MQAAQHNWREATENKGQEGNGWRGIIWGVATQNILFLMCPVHYCWMTGENDGGFFFFKVNWCVSLCTWKYHILEYHCYNTILICCIRYVFLILSGLYKSLQISCKTLTKCFCGCKLKFLEFLLCRKCDFLFHQRPKKNSNSEMYLLHKSLGISVQQKSSGEDSPF